MLRISDPSISETPLSTLSRLGGHFRRDTGGKKHESQRMRRNAVTGNLQQLWSHAQGPNKTEPVSMQEYARGAEAHHSGRAIVK